MSLLEIKSHSWKDSREENYGSRFFPFAEGIPVFEVANCKFCSFYQEGTDCKKLQQLSREGMPDGDHLLFAFCGNVCGYFDPTVEALEMIEEKMQKMDFNFDANNVTIKRYSQYGTPLDEEDEEEVA